MSTIFDLLYREYCRARLAEMRKQLLSSVAGDEVLETYWDGGDPAGRRDGNSVSGEAAAPNEAPTTG